MARPAPDPEQVVAVYEMSLKGWSYRRIAEQAGISKTAVGEWVRQGAAWWQATERLDHAAEYALARQSLSMMMEWLQDAHDTGELSTAEAIPLGLKILDRQARQTGTDSPTRVSVEATTDERPAPPPAAVRAIEDMRKRATTRERMVIDGDQSA